MSVKAAATMPPVHDSAVAIVSLRMRQRSSNERARARASLLLMSVALLARPGQADRGAVGRGALPLRVARRKVRTDIAIGQRAENGVDQRMQPDVAIGMSQKAAAMRN